MDTRTERIRFLVTPREKARISKAAKAAGVSMSEWVRRAACSYCPGDNESALGRLLIQVRGSAAAAGVAIDHALAEVAASNARIEGMGSVARNREIARDET